MPLAATVIFVAFDGEELGLLGSAAHAKLLAGADTKVDGMIGCDIVGNTLGMDGVRYDRHVRCFSYAPSGNDSFGRSMGARRDLCRGHASARLRRQTDPARRSLRPRRRPPFVLRAGLPRGAVDGAARGLLAAAPERRRTRWQAVWRRARIRGLRLHGERHARGRRYARRAGRRRRRRRTSSGRSCGPTAYDTEIDYELPPGVDRCEFVWRETTAADWTHTIDMATAKPTRRAPVPSSIGSA
jgi:hypothetical protein